MRVAHPRYPFFEEVWRESSLDYVSLTDRINVRTYCAWCAVLYWSVCVEGTRVEWEFVDRPRYPEKPEME